MRNALFIGLISLVNLLFTFVNSYPILYSDTSTYISSGFELIPPFDRPITYGILLRLFSLNGLTFLLVPFFQSLIFTIVLYFVIETILGEQRIVQKLFFLVVLLSLSTGFNWSINQLLPDFLTPLGLLTIFILFVKGHSTKRQVFLFFLMFFSAASHISNVFVFIVVLIFLLLFYKKQNDTLNWNAFKIKTFSSFLILAVAYLIMMSAISKSRNVFFAGSMAQKGILQMMLKDKCSTSNFKLCLYKDSIPQSFEYFVWNNSSPIYKMGGWKEARGELKTLATLSLSESKYIKMHLFEGWKNFTQQLNSFDIGEGNGVFLENTLLIQRIKNYSKLDKELCALSIQNTKGFILIDAMNKIYRATTYLSILLLLSLYALYYKTISIQIKILTCVVLITVMTSSLMVAFTSEVSNRHGCKLMWLFMLVNLLIIIQQWSFKNKSVD